ncbi:MAG TPA: hypothetical protein VIH03_05085 [Nitrososphaerales archaeon]
MPIDTQKVRSALEVLGEDRYGFFLSGWFNNLSADLYISSRHSNRYAELYKHTTFIQDDLWNIQTIVFRLEWHKGLYAKNQLSDGIWMAFAGCDINTFYIEMRSILDYAAKIIREISDKPGQVRNGSFEQLSNWTNNPKSHDKLGKELVSLIQYCSWFEEIKNIRDGLVHQGNRPLVFIDKKEILFQVYKGLLQSIRIPEIMFNENVVNFERYAGLYLAYLIDYLEKLSEIAYKKLNLKKSPVNARSYNLGVEIVRSWINNLLVSNKNL